VNSRELNYEDINCIAVEDVLPLALLNENMKELNVQTVIASSC
jgi:hypothetical protein